MWNPFRHWFNKNCQRAAPPPQPPQPPQELAPPAEESARRDCYKPEEMETLIEVFLKEKEMLDSHIATLNQLLAGLAMRSGYELRLPLELFDIANDPSIYIETEIDKNTNEVVVKLSYMETGMETGPVAGND